MTDEAPNVVKASPTKDLFVSTLVRDIPIDRAILDLIDNCIDGAKRLRKTGRLDGLSVEITANKGEFRIKDNCGGIPLELARNYAFRFGRPVGMPKTPHSVGQFGVGMKRALFKLGNKFSVDSVASHSRFKMSLDVEVWKSKTDAEGKEDWTFPLDSSEDVEAEIPAAEWGTTISVTQLNRSVSAEFELSNFISKLDAEIGTTQELHIENGLSIRLNGTSIGSRPRLLAQSKLVRPTYIKFSVNGTGSSVNVRLYAGVTNEERTEFADAGWYIFCNDRLIVGADQTEATGWSETKFHPTFNRFRGFAFLDCEDASRLPWNTMKSGLDVSSAIYAGIRIEIVNATRPVLSFLTDFAKETAESAGELPLHEALSNASMVPLLSIVENKRFLAPSSTWKPKKPPRMQWVRFQKPRTEVDSVKKALGVASVSDAGAGAFDYFYQHECND